MSKVLMILDGISTSNIHLFSGCEYKNGKIGFEKGTYFKLCSCLIESKRTIREKGRIKEKPKALPTLQKILPKTEAPVVLPQQTVELKKNQVPVVLPQISKLSSDTGGISKEDFRKQIQARKNK